VTRAAVGWSLGKLKYVGGVYAAKRRARVACGAEKLVVEFSPATKCALVLEMGKIPYIK